MPEGNKKQTNKVFFSLFAVITFLTVLLFILIISDSSLAFEQHTTHPALTLEIVKFFNAKNTLPDRTFSAQEIGWLKQGAIEEDTPARWS